MKKVSFIELILNALFRASTMPPEEAKFIEENLEDAINKAYERYERRPRELKQQDIINVALRLGYNPSSYEEARHYVRQWARGESVKKGA